MRGWSASETELARVSAWAFQSAACKPYAHHTATRRTLQQSAGAACFFTLRTAVLPRPGGNSSQLGPALAARSLRGASYLALLLVPPPRRPLLARAWRCFCFVISLRCVHPLCCAPRLYVFVFPVFSDFGRAVSAVTVPSTRGPPVEWIASSLKVACPLAPSPLCPAPYSCPQLRLSGSLTAVAARLPELFSPPARHGGFSHVLVWRLADHKYRSAAERPHVHGAPCKSEQLVDGNKTTESLGRNVHVSSLLRFLHLLFSHCRDMCAHYASDTSRPHSFETFQ